jgi:hypothetical protein
MQMLFNDILGNHQLYTGLALNGQVIDAAGQVSYINSKNRDYLGGPTCRIYLSSPEATTGVTRTIIKGAIDDAILQGRARPSLAGRTSRYWSVRFSSGWGYLRRIHFR